MKCFITTLCGVSIAAARVKEMSVQREAWARRVGVMPWPLHGGEAKNDQVKKAK